jgi:hypothetical protein
MAGGIDKISSGGVAIKAGASVTLHIDEIENSPRVGLSSGYLTSRVRRAVHRWSEVRGEEEMASAGGTAFTPYKEDHYTYTFDQVTVQVNELVPGCRKLLRVVLGSASGASRL